MVAAHRTPLLFASALVLAHVGTGCGKDKATASPDDAMPAETVADDDADDMDEAVDEPDSEPAAATLDKSNFESTVNDNMQDVIDCYSEAVTNNADLAGTLESEFKFAGDGTLTEVIALEGSTLNDEGLLGCIGAKAQNWGFAKPPSEDGMALDFPFTLEPG